MWRYVKRNRVTIGIIVCGLLALGMVVVFGKYWRGGCGGAEAERAVVEDLNRDPLLTAAPPEATQVAASTKYRNCGRPPVKTVRGPVSRPRPIAVELVREYRLATGMTAADLHDHYVHTVGLAGWRLTHIDDRSLGYCRVARGNRVVTLMTLGDGDLRIATTVWNDGTACADEVAIT